MHKIQNPQLEELDEELFDFNKYFAYFKDGTSNKYAYEDITDRLKKLRKKTSELTAYTEFDSLVLENILRILEAQQKLSDHFSYKTQEAHKEDIIKLVDLCLGDEFFLRLEDEIKDRDELEKNLWEQRLSYNNRGLNIVRSDSIESYKEIEKLIPQIKQNIIQEGIKRGFIPKDYDFKILEFPPGIDIRSTWNPTLKVMELGVNSFQCLQENSKLRVNTIYVYRTLFHEILGHAAHQQNSEDMPLTLRMAGFNLSQIINNPHIEGISTTRERLIVDYISKNLERLNIKSEELKTLELDLKTQVKSNIPFLYKSFLKEIKLFDPSFDIENHIFCLTGSKRFSNYLSIDYDKDLDTGEAIKESSYFAGQLLMQRTKQMIVDKFGQEFYDQNQPKIASAMTRGVWSWKVYPKAVEYFLRQSES